MFIIVVVILCKQNSARTRIPYKMLTAESDTFDTYVEDIQIVDSNIIHQKKGDKQRYTGAIPKNMTQSESGSQPPQALPQVEHLPRNFKTVVDMINKGYRVCIILRGLPGSGKSFLAHQIIGATVKDLGEHILSADNFFLDRKGKYRFDPSKLTDAHSTTQNRFTQLASKGVSPLISDNTNLEYWNMYHYLQVAVQYGYHIEIMEPATPWKLIEHKLEMKNQHGVPGDRIKLMKRKYETGAKLEDLLFTLNLDVVRDPKMRNVPPLHVAPLKIVEVPSEVPVVKDLIDFRVKPTTPEFEWKLYEKKEESQAIVVKEPPPSLRLQTSLNQLMHWSPPPQFIEQTPEPIQWSPTHLIEKTPDPPSEDPKSNEQSWQQQTSKKQRKKNRSPQTKLLPHRKSCPNENVSFAQIRELYPFVKDSYLWDFFERCKGDADWCVNLLCDENLTDQMEAGNDLTCTCFTVDSSTKSLVAKVKEAEMPKPQQQGNQSPTGKTKKATKHIDLEDWLKTKDELTQNIGFGDEHYPNHVKQVKNWKKIQSMTVAETIAINAKSSTPQQSITPSDVGDELHELTIPENLVMELDEEYGGGLLKEMMESTLKFPTKMFIKKSTAHQFYLDIVEACHSRKEEARFQAMKADEELAKKLNELETMPLLPQKESKKNGNKEVLEIENMISTWKNVDMSDDIAVRMSKEKLIELFPGVEKAALMEIFAGHDYNFNETVLLVQDSFNCSAKERKEIAKVQKKIFNTTWQEQKSEEKEEEEIDNGYTNDHLKTVEHLRQQFQDHKEEQNVCINRSKEAIQKKNFELASYLSNIASFHRQKAEEVKHEVANMMAAIHEKTQGDDKTLDLHYLNLVEAAVSLDTFLDRNISRLRAIKKPYEELHIITGRGLHSVNGIASIKNQTKSRLRERSLT